MRMMTCLIFLLEILSIGTPRRNATGTSVMPAAVASAMMDYRMDGQVKQIDLKSQYDSSEYQTTP
jgi:hypothetical protein